VNLVEPAAVAVGLARELAPARNARAVGPFAAGLDALAAVVAPRDRAQPAEGQRRQCSYTSAYGSLAPRPGRPRGQGVNAPSCVPHPQPETPNSSAVHMPSPLRAGSIAAPE
jgi:hypothetical protein